VEQEILARVKLLHKSLPRNAFRNLLRIRSMFKKFRNDERAVAPTYLILRCEDHS
jgi:hypothetical protein